MFLKKKNNMMNSNTKFNCYIFLRIKLILELLNQKQLRTSILIILLNPYFKYFKTVIEIDNN